MESLFPGKNMFGAVLPYFDNAVSVDAESFITRQVLLSSFLSNVGGSNSC
jgi:hypothetical protein